MSTERRKPGGRIGRTEQRGPNGRGICRWCQVEVPKGRHTFCGDACVHEWRLRTDPGYLREQVFARDRGICKSCGLDTIQFYRRFQRLAARKRNFLRRRLDLPDSRRSFWDADHIVAVAEGGGVPGGPGVRGTGPSNMRRTLGPGVPARKRHGAIAFG